MGIQNVLLRRRATVRAVIEGTYGTPAAMLATDAVLCSDPSYTVDPNVLERDFVSDTLSPQANIMGRMLARAEFTTELRSNGKTASGSAGDAPIISRLMRACGFGLTANAAPFLIGPFQTDDGTQIGFSATSPGTVTELTDYVVTVSTGGASGAAMAMVESAVAGEGSAPKTITSGTAFTLGTKGVTVTPTFTGNLTVGQQFTVWASPAGLFLKPRSQGFESITIEIFMDGVKHVIPGCFGSFEITAQSGQFATVRWNFTGLYLPPSDGALPTMTYEKTLPSQVELAKLRLDGDYLVVDRFSYNQQNDINIRPDVNSAQGYIGTRITGRAPTGGIDPEADLVASHDFWGKLSSALRMPFSMRVGVKPGNTVWMIAQSTQYTGLTYQDRDGILTYDAGLKFSRVEGDDEFMMVIQ